MFGRLQDGVSWVKRNATTVVTAGVVVTAVSVMSVVSLLGQEDEDDEVDLERSVSWSDEHGRPLASVMSDGSERKTPGPVRTVPARGDGDDNVDGNDDRTSTGTRVGVGVGVGAGRAGAPPRWQPPMPAGHKTLQPKNPQEEERKAQLEKDAIKLQQYVCEEGAVLEESGAHLRGDASPQWGWYVSITPEEQEKFERENNAELAGGAKRGGQQDEALPGLVELPE